MKLVCVLQFSRIESLFLGGVLLQFLVARTQLFSPLNTFGFQQNIFCSKFPESLSGKVVYL